MFFMFSNFNFDDRMSPARYYTFTTVSEYTHESNSDILQFKTNSLLLDSFFKFASISVRGLTPFNRPFRVLILTATAAAHACLEGS